MVKRKVSPAMRAMYEAKRTDTLTKIREVIHNMKEWNEPVTKKEIMKRTGVSSGTLSKPYVLELLRAERVCQFAELPQEKAVANQESEKEFSSMAKEIRQLKKKIEKMGDQIVLLRKQKDKIQKELNQEKEDNEFYRGQRQMLLERLESAGVSIGEIKLIK